MNLIELAERVEGAEGTSPQLDRDISAALDVWWMPDSTCAGPWTFSIDAALALVPEGCRWDIAGLENGRAGARVWSITGPVPPLTAKHLATPALALVAAALRARAAMEEHP